MVFIQSFFFKSAIICHVSRSIIVLFLLLFSAEVQAKNYYFSSSTGNDAYTSTQAQSEATPWKSIDKLNSFFSSIVAGDNIYFKRGDVFYGSIVVTKSGSSGSPILFGAYGSGNKPIISGFTNVGSWTSVSSGIYQVNVAAAKNTLNLVVINGLPQQIGRYPNNNYPADPYLYYETFNSNGTSITDAQLTSGTNWTGAEVVIKKRRWILDRCKITNHSGGTITYTNPTTYPGVVGFGYFIQNDPRTLDKFGEWYLNPTTKNLQVYFGTNQPTAYAVKVSSIDNLLTLGSNRFISINNLTLEGANVTGLSSQNGGDISIIGCDFNLMGQDGIFIQNTPNVLIDNVNLNHVLNNGINISNSNVNNAVVKNSSIKNCGMIAGMGKSGDGSYRGLTATVNSGATVEYNKIDSIGYNALEFQGSNVNISYNYINSFCMVKDDGGGIYTWANNSTNYVNRKIYNNLVFNAKGDPFGTAGKTAEAKGIYMDGGSINVDIYNNTVAHIARTALLLNNAAYVKLNGNTVYNARFGVELVRLTNGGLVRNIEMKNNTIYPKEVNQSAVYYKNWYLNTPTTTTIQQDIQSIGILDSNYYAVPNNIGFGILYSLDYTANPSVVTVPPFNFDGWKTYTKKDLSSKIAAKSPASVDLQRLEYNATNTTKTIPLDAKYVGPDGTIYNGSITLQPFTSKILVRDGAITTAPPPPPPPVTTGFTATATAPEINCFGGNTNVTVSASGGTLPYTGTGTFTVNAGNGSLRVSVANPVAGDHTLLYSTIGAVSNTKSYVLRFSTLGTSPNGSLRAALRQTSSPWSTITATQSKSFGTGRVDHQFIFTAPPTTAAASFLIEVLQTSGTTYIDNIAFFESTAAGIPINSNLYDNTQLENDISDIFTWSPSNNHVVALDKSSKISNTYYYTIQDATGAKAIASAITSQPAAALIASSSAGNIAVFAGTTTVVVAATGGTAPYTGTGSFTNVKAGTYNYTVTDDNGCTSVTSITITQPAGSTAFIATASNTDISCFGGNTNVTVTASGGTTPYTGTGTYTVNAGKGSLRVSVANPVAGDYTLLYSTIGAVTNTKSYVLRFSTLGTTASGSLRAALRQTSSPWSNITSTQTRSFGTSRIDHQFIFTAPPTTAAASFLIEILQSSGTTYINNIAFFESSSTGVLINDNQFNGGQFESSISNVFTWSPTNNHVASLDLSSKISNTYYYPVQDASGAKLIAIAATTQADAALVASATSGNISVFGGTTTVVVSASGGSAPYTGTGSFTNVKAGTYNYTVTDDNGCASVATITITQPAGSSLLNATASAPAINCFGGNTNISVTASGGTSPYSGTGSYTVNAGTGSLRISVANPVSGNHTLIYSTIGAVTNTKNYVLRFSTLGTTASGSLKAALRQTSSPWSNITSTQTRSFGTSRTEHQFIFTAPPTIAAASFLIEVLQSSGTTYIDNIAFFESTAAGEPINNNLFSGGQFEGSISNVFTWSPTNNHVAALDLSSKISNTYYYPVQDASGTKVIASATTTQPIAALRATSTAGTVTTTGGSTTVVVSATGGTAPYSGTGSFGNVKVGTYNYTVTDSRGCTSVTTITVTQNTAARTSTSTTNSTSGGIVSSSSLMVQNEYNALNISSYPNPTNTEISLNVNGGTSEKVDIFVMSVEGRIVYKTQGTSNRRYLLGKNLSSGIYIIQVIQGKTMQTLKVTKTN